MTDDLRARLKSALAIGLMSQPGGHLPLGVRDEAEWLADVVFRHVGTVETEWSTLCDGHRYPALERTARYRAVGAGHVLQCRDILAGSWHEPENPDADQVPVRTDMEAS